MMRHRVNILGVGIRAIDMEMALHTIEAWLAQCEPHYVCVSATHGTMESQREAELQRLRKAAQLGTPDGMLLAWWRRALGLRRRRRVYGPALMLAICERSAPQGYRHFFYGGAPGVADRMASRLQGLFPGLDIAGTYCPPARLLTPEEDLTVVEQINMAQPDIVWVGLRTPRQERWIAAHLPLLSAPVLVGVGAAFDFLADVQQQAPRWMPPRGLAWWWRLWSETRRLWRCSLRNRPRVAWRFLLTALGWKGDTVGTPDKASSTPEGAREGRVFWPAERECEAVASIPHQSKWSDQPVTPPG